MGVKVHTKDGTSEEDYILLLAAKSATYNAWGKYNESKECAEKGKEYLGKKQGALEKITDPMLMELYSCILCSYATVLNRMGTCSDAITILQAVYEKDSKILGENHSASCSALNILAVSYSDFGDHQKALELGNRQKAIELDQIVKEKTKKSETKADMKEIKSVLFYSDAGIYFVELSVNSEYRYTYYTRRGNNYQGTESGTVKSFPVNQTEAQMLKLIKESADSILQIDDVSVYKEPYASISDQALWNIRQIIKKHENK